MMEVLPPGSPQLTDRAGKLPQLTTSGSRNKRIPQDLYRSEEVTVHWNAALLCAVYLMVRAWSVCATPTGPQNCPAVCSCSNQFSKVVCTRRGLVRVPPGIPTNTRHLNLMENSIEVIHADTFRHLHHLEVLQLGRNSIRQIEVGAFNGLTNLNTLELFDNRLTVIPSGAFEYLSKLRELWLRNNPIESIPSYAFNRVPSLMRLDLGELKKLEYISEGAFEGLYNLKYLNLGMCNLREMPVLTPLVGLEELEMSENYFPDIKPGSFRGLKSLKKLWIMNSKITTMERNAFDDVTALVELNLAHNNLSSLPHDLFAPLSYLVELHLHHNPWRCDCDVVWLAWWLREYIPTNSTCCGRCHSPAHLRGRYLVEVDQTTFQCSAPFILDAPRDLNISAERVAEFKCRTAPMSSVRWLLPNGTVLTHGSNHPRIYVLNDGTLNFSNVLPSDTVTVEIVESISEETPRQVSVPTIRGTVRPPASLDEAMKTTKIIIGCFVAITLLAAIMLIAFYKLRKRHQQRSTVAAARTAEIVQMEENVPPNTSGTTLPGEGGMVLASLRDRNNTYKSSYSTYKPAHSAPWTENSISNSLHRPRPTISTIQEPYMIKTHTKEKINTMVCGQQKNTTPGEQIASGSQTNLYIETRKGAKNTERQVGEERGAQ
ncbi:hypothetical protein QTP70_012638 [Hemibagrus guttatus]|uniref:Uncharacterized protein n=1 Tax=Hemibagrus guttatus TaxID=175788 RepID=A0AAE0RAB7_9TELE|nr:hypothetical protein QTP70_012638 [Hemibagrus guttatus]KAK3569777.1 hypothetical protein QTP86_004432 [Hemibagrus guttatus]